MNLQHVNIKIYVDEGSTVDMEQLIPVFHRWIAEQAFDEMLIDVADYRHVPAGPGVVLVGLNVDYSMDNTGDRWGLRFNCKAARDGSNEDRFRYSFESVTKACSLLEAEFETLKFDRGQFTFFINDRALAPNTEETHAAGQSIVPDLIQRVLGHDQFELDFDRDPRRLYGAHVRLATSWDASA